MTGGGDDGVRGGGEGVNLSLNSCGGLNLDKQ